MSSKYKTHPGGLYFITLTVSGWIDLFTRAEYADILLTGLAHCIRRKGLRVYEYVIMPSHAHLLADLTDDDALLADVLRDFKSYAAKRIYELIEINSQESRRDWLLYQLQFFGQPHGQAFKIWQEDAHPIALLTPDQTQRCQHYIRYNPVVARIVTEPEHYVFSSACPDQLLPLSGLGC